MKETFSAEIVCPLKNASIRDSWSKVQMFILKSYHETYEKIYNYSGLENEWNYEYISSQTFNERELLWCKQTNQTKKRLQREKGKDKDTILFIQGLV